MTVPVCYCFPRFISPVYLTNTIHHLCSYLQFSPSCLAAAAVSTTHGPPYASQVAPAISSSCWLRCLFPPTLPFPHPRLFLTSLQPSQAAILSSAWTSSGQMKTQKRISLWSPRAVWEDHIGRKEHPDIYGYSYLGMVHVQSGHTSDFWEIKQAQFRHKSQTLAAKC